MIELVISAEDRHALMTRLLAGRTEECAILFAHQSTRDDGLVRLLVREVEFPTSSDYLSQGVTEAELAPAFVARVTKKAKLAHYSLVFVHSHLGTQSPRFSQVDDAGESRLAAFLAYRHSELFHAALVVSAGGVYARQLGTQKAARVIALGKSREVLADAQSSDYQVLDVFDRQIRAFGVDGQAALQKIRVAIVGLGGTGSLVAQQLAHLGIKDFILIDPDTLERSNLNRVVGARSEDVGDFKVDVAKRLIHSLNESATVNSMTGDIIHAKTACKLINADVIFGCTDSHGSRAVLQQIAYQYLIPCIDMGTVIATENGKVTYISGRAQLLSPGLGCLSCSGLLNTEEVRRDMMSSFERQADPYISGAREPAPAVVSINSTIASLAVTIFLAVVAGIPSSARQVLYDGVKASLRSVETKPDPSCYICSKEGSLAQGDEWSLMARQD